MSTPNFLLTGIYTQYIYLAMRKRGMKRPGGRLLTVWIPQGLEAPLASGAEKTGADKSKFVRMAIREKLARHGAPIPAGITS